MASAGETDPIVARDVVDLASHLDLRAQLEPGELVVGVGPDGAIYAARGRRAVRWTEGGANEYPLEAPMRAHFLQPHPDGLLFAHWDGGAVVVDAAGHLGARMHLGDAVDDVRTSADGTIWVSYGDEGDLTGLAQFDAHGARTWKYDPAAAGTEHTVCAYALHVDARGGAWFTFHPGFPIVRVRGGRYEVWTNGIRGARGLAVDGARVLLVGSDADRDAVHLSAHRVRLEKDRVAAHEDSTFVTGPNGESLRGARVWGGAQQCFFLLGTRVLVVDAW